MSRGFAPRPAAERFWPKVIKGECWLWRGARNARGYGVFNVGPGQGTSLAHRWAYEALVGPIPEGLTLDHLCLSKTCVNPEHLDPVSRIENKARGDRRRRQTHCDNGHPFTAENTYRRPSNPRRRECRACRKFNAAKADRKRRAVA